MNRPGSGCKLSRSVARSSVCKHRSRSQELTQSGSSRKPREDRKVNAFQMYTLKVECECILNHYVHNIELQRPRDITVGPLPTLDQCALEPIERLHEMQPNNIKTMLMLARCYLAAGRSSACCRITRRIRRTVTKTPRPETKDLIIRADECRANDERFTALVLLWSCCSVFKEDHTDSSALTGISGCLDTIDDIIEEARIAMLADRSARLMHRSFHILHNMLGVLLHMMGDTEILIQGINTDHTDKQSTVLLRCLGCKALCLYECQRLGEAIDLFGHCIKEMEILFGLNAPKLFMYGKFLQFTGCIQLQVENYQKALYILRLASAALSKCEPRNDQEMNRQQHALRDVSNDLKQVEDVLIKKVERILQRQPRAQPTELQRFSSDSSLY